MTARIKGINITLEKPMREDDAEQLMNMLHSLKNVASVNSIEEVPGDMIAIQGERSRITNQLMTAVTEIIWNTKINKAT